MGIVHPRFVGIEKYRFEAVFLCKKACAQSSRPATNDNDIRVCSTHTILSTQATYKITGGAILSPDTVRVSPIDTDGD
jgi:hypothetical protein